MAPQREASHCGCLSSVYERLVLGLEQGEYLVQWRPHWVKKRNNSACLEQTGTAHASFASDLSYSQRITRLYHSALYKYILVRTFPFGLAVMSMSLEKTHDSQCQTRRWTYNTYEAVNVNHVFGHCMRENALDVMSYLCQSAMD